MPPQQPKSWIAVDAGIAAQPLAAMQGQLMSPPCSPCGEKAAGIPLGKREGLGLPSFVHRQHLSAAEICSGGAALSDPEENLLWCLHPAGLSKTRHKALD